MEPETAVLSIILKNPTCSFELNGLRFYMMASISNQVLMQEIETLIEKQLTPDPQLLLSSLEGSGNLDKVGGKAYLDFLLNKSYDESGLSEWIRLTTQSYKTRTLISTISGIRAENITVDNIDTIISDTRRSLDNILETSGGSDTLHVGDHVKKAFDEIVARTNNPGVRGYSWGISDIDVATGGKSAGDLWVIGGRPGQGKTAFICNSILEDGKNGVPSLVFEREMNYQTLMERLVAIDTGISLQNIRLGILTKDQVSQIAMSLAKIKQYPIFLDTSYNSDLYYIQNTISKYKRLYNISVVYLDYLQIIAERDNNQTQELGRITRLLKIATLEHNLCIISLSQLNRGVEMRDNKRPIMSDLRQSGNLEEDAEYVVGLYRDEYYNKQTKDKGLLEFIILKARNGPIGTLTTRFESESNRITQYK